MAKILVNLAIPALSQNYDILIPDYLRVRLLTSLITEAVVELSSGHFVVSGKELLCSREQGKVLDLGQTIRDCGIRNGDHLYLF